jgi:DNA-binding PadR family transcriptional regulator
MSQTFDSQGAGRLVNEILLLAELGREPMHGYQIALNIEERSGGYFPFSHGTMYPILHRLEKEGLIAGSWSDPAKGRPRKEYALTEAGRAHLARHVEEWRTLSTRLDAFLSSEGGADGQVHTGAA